MDDLAFLATIQRLASEANAWPFLRRIGRFCSTDCLLATEDGGAYVSIAGGEIVAVQGAPRHLRSFDFSVRAALETWDEFWSASPRPQYHDIFALARFGHARIEGNLDPLLRELPYFKRLFWMPREFER